MAKSLRSKWKRKMRAIKRERYGVKELKQLQLVLKNVENKDIDMSDTCTVLPKGVLSKEKKSTEPERNIDESSQSGSMEVEGKKSSYNPVTLANEHGSYPVWMNHRAIKKHNARLRKLGIKKKNRVQKKGKKNKR